MSAMIAMAYPMAMLPWIIATCATATFLMTALRIVMENGVVTLFWMIAICVIPTPAMTTARVFRIAMVCGGDQPSRTIVAHVMKTHRTTVPKTATVNGAGLLKPITAVSATAIQKMIAPKIV